MKILIKVTKNVLRRAMYCGFDESLGKPNRACGIAVAVIDLFPTAEIHSDCIYWHDLRTSAQLDQETINWIKRFDRADPLERTAMNEYSFVLTVPEAVIYTIGISEVYKILSESKSLELVSI